MTMYSGGAAARRPFREDRPGRAGVPAAPGL